MGYSPPKYVPLEVKLSILMPSIPERRPKLIALIQYLRKQINYCREIHPTLGGVEIITDDSKRFLDGGLSIGKKREALVARAKGEYLCFLDDDEWVSPSYVETLLRLCYKDMDVCTFRNVSKFDNYWCIVDLGLKNPNTQAESGHIVRRRPWHICPVRSRFAKTFSFPDSNYGEDWVWFENVLTLCRTEAKTREVIHEYRHSDKTSEANKAHEKSLS